MSTLYPTTVSMYDILYDANCDLAPLLADNAHLSLEQGKHALSLGLQAVVAGILALHQTKGVAVLYDGLMQSPIQSAIWGRAIDFKMLQYASRHGQYQLNTLFGAQKVYQINAIIAQQTQANLWQIDPFFTAFASILLKKLAELIQTAQLDTTKLDFWLKLQPQFLQSQSFVVRHQLGIHANLPPFNLHWFDFFKFVLPADPKSVPLAQSSAFMPMPNIYLPEDAWLLDIAHCATPADDRLKIASPNFITDAHFLQKTPCKVPANAQQFARQFAQSSSISNRLHVSSPQLDGQPSANPAWDRPIEYDEPAPFWKNPTLLTVFGSIAIFFAIIFYQQKLQHERMEARMQAAQEAKRALEKDIAIVKVKEESPKKSGKKSKSSKSSSKTANKKSTNKSANKSNKNSKSAKPSKTDKKTDKNSKTSKQTKSTQSAQKSSNSSSKSTKSTAKSASKAPAKSTAKSSSNSSNK